MEKSHLWLAFVCVDYRYSTALLTIVLHEDKMRIPCILLRHDSCLSKSEMKMGSDG
jgi:hypothetical protein